MALIFIATGSFGAVKEEQVLDQAFAGCTTINVFLPFEKTPSRS